MARLPYVIGVRRMPLLFALSLSFLPAGAQSPLLSIDSMWGSTGELTLRAGLSLGDFRLFGECRDRAAAVNTQERRRFVLGMSLPWLRYGPLSPGGLFREAANPLGFSSHSDVFLQRTGLPLDESFDAGHSGIVFMPIPDALGLFCRPGTRGGLAYGCFASLLSSGGCGGEGVLSLSNPEMASEAGDDWFFTKAPFPGGELLLAAVRLRAVASGLSLAATLGGSWGERVPPGRFWHLRGSVFGNGNHVSVFLGSTGTTYRTFDGTESADAERVAVSAGATAPLGSLEMSYSLTLGQPAFAPSRFRPSREAIDAIFERVLADAGGAGFSLKVEAEKSIRRDAEGTRDDAVRCTVSARGSASAVEAVTGIDFIDPCGLAFFLTAALRPTGRRPHLSLAARWERHGAGGPELSAFLTLRLERAESMFSVETGVEDWPVSAELVEAARPIVLKISWNVRSAAVVDPLSIAVTNRQPGALPVPIGIPVRAGPPPPPAR